MRHSIITWQSKKKKKKITNYIYATGSEVGEFVKFFYIVMKLNSFFSFPVKHYLMV